MSTELSIIICTYNRAASLEIVLDSLLKQEGVDQENTWEIVVVDNNSSDLTKNTVKSFSKSLNIRYILEKRQGKSNALNTGIKNSLGRILAFTDDDVIIDRKWVKTILGVTRNNKYLVYGGRVVPVWPEKVPDWISKKGPYHLPIVGGPIVAHDLGNEPREYGKKMWVPTGANMFCEKKIFSRYGNYRVDLGPRPGKPGYFHEDSEVMFRLINNGIKLFYCQNAIVYHPVNKDRLNKKYIQTYFFNAGLSYDWKNKKIKKWNYLKKLIRQLIEVMKLLKNLIVSEIKDEKIQKMHYKCRVYIMFGQMCTSIRSLYSSNIR